MDKMSWIDETEKKRDEEFKEGYFNIAEGDNRVQILTHCAPLAQMWDNANKKYRVAEEGDKNPSIKGVCWLLHEGKMKQAKLPYTVVKAIRSLQNDSEWGFEAFPMTRQINIKAKDAGTKEVDYSVTPTLKEFPVSDEIMKELAARPTPEDIIEKMKNKVSPRNKSDYPEGPNPEDIPF